MNMKKIIAGIFAGLTITAASACATAHADFPTVPEGYYPATFIVTEVSWDADRELQILAAETATGIEYRWYDDAGDWAEGDLVSAVMYDMETPEVTDDLVLDARYAGIPEWYSDPASRPAVVIPDIGDALN